MNFTFLGLDIYSEDVNIPLTMTGINAQIVYSESYSQSSIIEYIAIMVAVLALLLGFISSILNEKLIGI